MSVPRRYPDDASTAGWGDVLLPVQTVGYYEEISATGGPPRPGGYQPTLDGPPKVPPQTVPRQSSSIQSPPLSLHDILPSPGKALLSPGGPTLAAVGPCPRETPREPAATPLPASGHFPDYDHYINRLADAQRYKLRLNAHKGDLGSVPVPDLLDKMRGEFAELEEAIKRNSEIEVILECADIMNFALGCAISAIRSMNGVGSDDSQPL